MQVRTKEHRWPSCLRHIKLIHRLCEPCIRSLYTRPPFLPPMYTPLSLTSLSICGGCEGAGRAFTQHECGQLQCCRYALLLSFFLLLYLLLVVHVCIEGIGGLARLHVPLGRGPLFVLLPGLVGRGRGV